MNDFRPQKLISTNLFDRACLAFLLTLGWCDVKDVGVNGPGFVFNQVQLDEVDIGLLEFAELDLAFDVAAFAISRPQEQK